MHSCSKIPSFLSSPNFLWKAKKSWGWFGCSWAEVFLVLLHPKFRVSVKNPTYYPTNSHQFIFQNIPQLQRSKGFQKMDPKLCFVQRTPKIEMHQDRQGHLGGSEGAAVTGVGKEDPEHLFAVPQMDLQHPWGIFGAPWPWQALVFVPLCPSGCSGV